VLQDRGLKVALVTDGRMSGASGKVPAAIHVSPEAACRWPAWRGCDGDIVRLDAVAGTLTVLAPDFDSRTPGGADLSANDHGIGRELFAAFRRNVGSADTGAAWWFCNSGPARLENLRCLRRGYFNQYERIFRCISGLRYRRGRR
jgi:phosphogluconate dehydratase